MSANICHIGKIRRSRAPKVSNPQKKKKKLQRFEIYARPCVVSDTFNALRFFFLSDYILNANSSSQREKNAKQNRCSNVTAANIVKNIKETSRKT